VKIAAGGSAANTLAGISVAFGGNGVFCGKIGKDKNGDIYIEETVKDGVKALLGRHDKITGNAITFITPDGERTFATHLGAAVELRKEDVSEEEIAFSKILHVEGYQLEDKELKETALHAMKIAKENSVIVSIDLADAGLVKRNLEEFRKIVIEFGDIVFANENEAYAFTGKEGIDAIDEINTMCKIAVVKLGKKGSLIKYKDIVYKIPSFKVETIDTTGAGDMYAAGILYGIANGIPLGRAGKMASYAASLVVSQMGARLNRNLNDDIKKMMFY
jgi:sugar/nucleoside kinase (ribokinase family)